METLQKFSAHDFMSLRLDTERQDCRMQYLHKKRNLQYLIPTIQGLQLSPVGFEFPLIYILWRPVSNVRVHAILRVQHKNGTHVRGRRLEMAVKSLKQRLTKIILSSFLQGNELTIREHCISNRYWFSTKCKINRASKNNLSNLIVL